MAKDSHTQEQPKETKSPKFSFFRRGEQGGSLREYLLSRKGKGSANKPSASEIFNSNQQDHLQSPVPKKPPLPEEFYLAERVSESGVPSQRRSHSPEKTLLLPVPSFSSKQIASLKNSQDSSGTSSGSGTPVISRRNLHIRTCSPNLQADVFTETDEKAVRHASLLTGLQEDNSLEKANPYHEYLFALRYATEDQARAAASYLYDTFDLTVLQEKETVSVLKENGWNALTQGVQKTLSSCVKTSPLQPEADLGTVLRQSPAVQGIEKAEKRLKDIATNKKRPPAEGCTLHYSSKQAAETALDYLQKTYQVEGTFLKGTDNKIVTITPGKASAATMQELYEILHTYAKTHQQHPLEKLALLLVRGCLSIQKDIYKENPCLRMEYLTSSDAAFVFKTMAYKGCAGVLVVPRFENSKLTLIVTEHTNILRNGAPLEMLLGYFKHHAALTVGLSSVEDHEKGLLLTYKEPHHCEWAQEYIDHQKKGFTLVKEESSDGYRLIVSNQDKTALQELEAAIGQQQEKTRKLEAQIQK